MIFKDEKYMWYADTELLAKKLADKSVSEIQEILDDHDVIRLQSTERPSMNIFNRLSIIVIHPLLFTLFCIKWLFTGSGYLDSWARKNRLIKLMFKVVGQN